MLPHSHKLKSVRDESGASNKQFMRTIGGRVAGATFYFPLRLGLACLIYSMQNGPTLFYSFVRGWKHVGGSDAIGTLPHIISRCMRMRLKKHLL